MFDARLFKRRLDQAIASRQITAAAFVVGHALLVYVDRKGTCWPAQRTLAERTGRNEKTVRTALGQLRGLGLLSWRPRWAKWNRRASNVYSLLGAAALPVAQKKEDSRGSAPATPAGSPKLAGAALEAALGRLGTLMGCPTGAVMPWLGVG